MVEGGVKARTGQVHTPWKPQESEEARRPGCQRVLPAQSLLEVFCKPATALRKNYAQHVGLHAGLGTELSFVFKI